MLVVTRYRVLPTDAGAFLERARAALGALATRTGCLDGVVGRATDDPGLWTLTTRWHSVGDYRRALSSYEVKLHVHALVQHALDEPTAFEVLLATAATGTPGELVESASDLAPDADTAGPGDALR